MPPGRFRPVFGPAIVAVGVSRRTRRVYCDSVTAQFGYIEPAGSIQSDSRGEVQARIGARNGSRGSGVASRARRVDGDSVVVQVANIEPSGRVQSDTGRA